MTVDEFANALISSDLEFVTEGQYTNSSGQIGYRAIYRNTLQYLWFSVSGTETPFAPDEVAFAIRAAERWICRENPYFNRKGKQGFEATILSAGHAFMLNAAPDPPRFR